MCKMSPPLSWRHVRRPIPSHASRWCVGLSDLTHRAAYQGEPTPPLDIDWQGRIRYASPWQPLPGFSGRPRLPSPSPQKTTFPESRISLLRTRQNRSLIRPFCKRFACFRSSSIASVLVAASRPPPARGRCASDIFCYCPLPPPVPPVSIAPTGE